MSTDSMMQGAQRLLMARVDELRARHGADFTPELLELEHALDKMADGTWGRCECCEGAIGRDRLRALPETRKCLECATK